MTPGMNNIEPIRKPCSSAGVYPRQTGGGQAPVLLGLNNIEQQVKQANKLFYDTAGHLYEEIDGRRSKQLISYGKRQLEMISKTAGHDCLLDLGCGSGFIARMAGNLFNRVYAVDISQNILKAIGGETIRRVCADSDFVPLKDGQVNCVATFAVLHHCFSYEKILPEVYRVLKQGGVYYSDHDLDDFFYQRYKPLLKVYRGLNDAKEHYLSRFSQLTKDIYDFSEFHQDGIPAHAIKSDLMNAGFRDVRIEYHWFGLSPLTDKIFSHGAYRRGFAPLARIWAYK